jgi:hypothetical protein
VPRAKEDGSRRFCSHEASWIRPRNSEKATLAAVIRSARFRQARFDLSTLRGRQLPRMRNAVAGTHLEKVRYEVLRSRVVGPGFPFRVEKLHISYIIHEIT